MVPLSWYLVLSAVLFTLGAVGLFVKRNIISIFMCIELMLNAVNLSLVAFSSFLKHLDGQLFVFMVIGGSSCGSGRRPCFNHIGLP